MPGGGESQLLEGELRSSGLSMEEDPIDHRVERSGLYLCDLSKKNGEQFVANHLSLEIYIDRYIEDLGSFVRDDFLKNKAGSVQSIQLEEVPLTLQLSKNTYDRDVIYLKHEMLPFNYLAVLTSQGKGMQFPPPFVAQFSCSVGELFSKNGTIEIQAAKDYRPNGIYATISGNMVVGGSYCF